MPALSKRQLGGIDDMSARRQGLAMGCPRRLLILIGASTLALAIFMTAATARASAAVPEKTDIMFIFDTSGSMSEVLEEAKAEIKTLVANTEKSLPNVEFGVANVEDVPGYELGEFQSKLTETEYEESHEKPWRLDQSLTAEESKVENAITELSGPEVEHFGGDGPEAYGRALYETATNPEVKWRTGARHEIVMIADNVPHTPNVNEGIPSEFWLENPFDTFEEPPGKFGIPDTQWKEGESLEFHKTLTKLDSEAKPLAMVDYFHTGESESESYIHYWEYWAAATGGQAITSQEGAKSLDAKLAEIIKESAEGIPPCPPGFERTETTPCVKKPTTSSSSTSSTTTTPSPPPPPPPPPPTNPPNHGKVIVLENGEVEEEDEFPEGGSAEFFGEVLEWDDLAEVASLQASPFAQTAQQTALAAAKPKKCKKNAVRRHGKCVSKTTLYGSVHLTITTAGKYKLRIKPSRQVLRALKKGKRMHVKLTLIFTPAGTTDHIRSAHVVTVRQKSKHKKK